MPNYASQGYQLQYEINPISLTRGIAGGIPGGQMSVLSIVQAMDFGGLTGTSDLNLDDAFANFYPIAGSTLIDLQIGAYPFANMSVAANATIRQPLVTSLQMRIPAKTQGALIQKAAIMTALQATLDQHIQAGGTFTVSTPAFTSPDWILLKLHDVTGGELSPGQPQAIWQWDFIKPLVSLDDAAAAQNAMMSQLSSGGITDGSLAGVSTTIGQPTSAASPSVSPAISGASTPYAGADSPGAVG